MDRASEPERVWLPVSEVYFEARYDGDPVVMALVEAYEELRQTFLKLNIQWTDDMRMAAENRAQIMDILRGTQEERDRLLSERATLQAEIERLKENHPDGRRDRTIRRHLDNPTSVRYASWEEAERTYQWVQETWKAMQPAIQQAHNTGRNLKVGETYQDPKKRRSR